MLPCAAYLRVYEPLSAFGETERTHWSAYAAGESRPQRANALETEHLEALHRIIGVVPVVAPERESGDAYVRWADGSTYVCPWQTRLRSWLAIDRLGGTARLLLSGAGAEAGEAAAAAQLACWREKGGSLRTYIRSCTWTVPRAWFVPFAPAERWLVTGVGQRRGRGPATAAAARALLYATAMGQARRRVAGGLAALRRASTDTEPGRRGQAGTAVIVARAELEEIGSWLERFHPRSLVELDYGGLVQLLDDEALRADQSVAEVAAALSALAGKEFELAAALDERLRARWRRMEAAELSN